MFNKKNDEAEITTEAPKPESPEPAEELRKRNISVIGPTLHFKGELSANEDLVIEGHIEGRIAHQDKNLTIGEKGRVHADIHAKAVEIRGEVDGDVRGDEIVHLKSSAVVNGNISSPRVTMEDGAYFTGSVEMGRSTTETKEDDAEREHSNLATLPVTDSPTAHAPNGGG